MGKALVVGSFKRPLLAIIREMYLQIEKAREAAVVPAKAAVDEVVCMMTLAVQSQAEIRTQVSEVVSCTDTTATGGSIARATKFRSSDLVPAQPEEFPEECGSCKTSLLELRKSHRFPCPRMCGRQLCSLGCTIWHREDGDCLRKDFYAPVFGERFSGPNFPLTRAVAMAGIAAQRPLDLQLPGGKSWDFFTKGGKEWLNQEEMDPELTAEHWSPNFRSFSMEYEAQGPVRGKGKMKGSRAVRSKEAPWGLDMRRPSKDEVAKVRQDNKMAKKSLARLKEAGERGRFASLEHPYESYLRCTPEVKELRESRGFYFSTFSFCCYGGPKERWTGLLHNSAAIHSMIHKPWCQGHGNLSRDEGIEGKGGRGAPRRDDFEYPWAWCQSYARGLLMELKNKVPAPIGEMPRNHHSVIYSQVRGATRGFQDEGLVRRVVHDIFKMTTTMEKGNEVTHLEWMSRQGVLRGTDHRLRVPVEESGPREIVTPYPAFRWSWNQVATLQWGSEQSEDVLAMGAFLAELERRAQDSEGLKQHYVHVVSMRMLSCSSARG